MLKPQLAGPNAADVLEITGLTVRIPPASSYTFIFHHLVAILSMTQFDREMLQRHCLHLNIPQPL